MSVKKPQLKIGDFILFALILALAVAALFVVRNQGTVLTVRQNGKELYKVDIADRENDGKELVVSDEYTLVVAIKGGKVWVKEADCPDQICCHSGYIDESGGVICCAPAGVIITVSGKEEWDVMVQ